MKTLSLFIFLVLLSGCDIPFPSPDEKFGKQNFVSAISIIELHKVRNGTYPETLSDLKFLGDWDGIWLSAVKYEKTKNGYNLFVERGWVGKPSLVFPVEFKNGLGLNKSNVKWTTE